jgi:hypothetical protein
MLTMKSKVVRQPAVYGQNVMSEGTVRQWCRMFNDEETNVHNEEQSGQSAICSE